MNEFLQKNIKYNRTDDVKKLKQEVSSEEMSLDENGLSDLDEQSDPTEGDSVDSGTSEDDLFESIKTEPTQGVSLEKILQKQSQEKSFIVREQLKRLDIAYKLRILLQKLILAMNENTGLWGKGLETNGPESTELEKRLCVISAIETIQSLIQKLSSASTSQCITWIEPWYTSTQLSSQLKMTTQLKVIGQRQQHSAASFQQLIDWSLRQDKQKLLSKSTLNPSDAGVHNTEASAEDTRGLNACRLHYDDTEFYSSLLKDILSTKNLAIPEVSKVGQANNDVIKKSKSKQQKESHLLARTHDKLMNFMAPSRSPLWPDETMDQLYASLSKN